jgi:phenylalanyl-tRNA synthetase beta chain
LIEEIGRIYSYKNILSTPVSKIREPKVNKTFYYVNKIRKILTGLGFSEVYTYVFRDNGKVELENPLASNRGFMRENLKDGLQESLDFNLKNAPLLGQDEIKIFEIGKVFPSVDEEYNFFALGVVGKNKKSVIARIDEAIQKINEELNIDLDPQDINSGIFETNFDELLKNLPEPTDSYEDVLEKQDKIIVKFKPISAYPFMLRDIAVWVSNTESEEIVLNLIKENAGDLLVQTRLFDVYKPEDKDQTSYAFNLVFQSNEKTLTDDEVNVIMEKIAQKMKSINWEVR